MDIQKMIPNLTKVDHWYTGEMIFPLWNNIKIRFPDYAINESITAILTEGRVRIKFVSEENNDFQISGDTFLNSIFSDFLNTSYYRDKAMIALSQYYIDQWYVQDSEALGGMDSSDDAFPDLKNVQNFILAQLVQLREVKFYKLSHWNTGVVLDFDTYWSEDGRRVYFRGREIVGVGYEYELPTE